MDWSEDRVATLKRMWAEGKSASTIAAELGSVSRNAVIGKVQRLNLGNQRAKQPRVTTTRRQPASPGATPATERRSLPSRPAAIEEVAALPVSADGLIRCENLKPDMCRWPIGDPGTAKFHFCGAKRRVGSYCETHARIAFNVMPVTDGKRYVEAAE